jgi:hypothetical protein
MLCNINFCLSDCGVRPYLVWLIRQSLSPYQIFGAIVQFLTPYTFFLLCARLISLFILSTKLIQVASQTVIHKYVCIGGSTINIIKSTLDYNLL